MTRGVFPHRQKIFLIGYMACGKTTLCNALHALTGIETMDLDEAIEDYAGLDIPQIFEKKGQDWFRSKETEILRCIAAAPGQAVIACGGGTPCHNDNLAIMRQYGTTVWLCASIDRICSRLLANRSSRPMLSGLSDDQLKAHIGIMLAEREQYYRQADYRFGSNCLESERQVVSAARRFARRFLQF